MNMCPSYKRKVPPESCLKGQIFFIYSNHPSQQLVQERIFRLGGRVDNFLTKDLTTVLVEDSHLLCTEFQLNDLNGRPAINPNSTAATGFNHSNLVYNLPSTSRGYNFLTSFVTSPVYRVICFARQWGIQVLGVAYFLATTDAIVNTVAPYIPQPKKNHNVSNLTGCFIKVECYHKKFRPCYKMFNNDPDRLMPLKNANFLIKPENCNVILDKPVSRRQLQYNPMDRSNRTTYNTHEARQPVKVNDKKFANKLKPKEENNYCECCKSNFTDLKLHIKSANHQKFVANEKNYETVNNILKMLPSAQEFIQKQRKPSLATDTTLHNGEVSRGPEKSIVEVDLVSSPTVQSVDSPVPLNLHIKAYPDNPSPLNLHVPREKVIKASPHVHVAPEPDISLSPHLQPPKENEMAMSPHLHLPREKDIAVLPNMPVHQNVEIKQQLAGPSLSFVKNEPSNPADKIEIDLKIEIDCLNVGQFGESAQSHPRLNDPPESAVSPIKNYVIPEETAAEDPLFDKNNSIALAQDCLRNFENYWLDTIASEVEDIMFDDNIFDFDDGKSKGNCADPNPPAELVDNFPPFNIAPDAGNDLRAHSNVDSLMEVKSTETKNVTDENKPGVSVRCSPVGKVEDGYMSSLTSPATIKVNEALPSNNKLSFNFAEGQNQAFFPGKPDPFDGPSCSKSMPNKPDEQMFSSDSSDDENENVFISNVLNTITFNSDSEMKVDKESSCDEPPVHKSKMVTPKKRRQGYLHKVEEICSASSKQTPVIEVKQAMQPDLSDCNVSRLCNANQLPARSIEHPILKGAESASLTKPKPSSVTETKPLNEVTKDSSIAPDPMHIYSKNSASVPSAEHFPLMSSTLLPSTRSSVSRPENTDSVSSAVPCLVQNAEVMKVSSPPLTQGPKKHTNIRHTDLGHTSNMFVPLANPELISSAELTPASSVEHTPARNGEFTSVSTVDAITLNYTEYAPVNYAAPTPVSNSERTPEPKQSLSSAEQAVLNSAKAALMNHPDYSMISSAEYSNPGDCGMLQPVGKVDERNMESVGKDKYEPMCMNDTDQGYVSKPDPPLMDPVCSNVKEVGYTAQINKIQIDAPGRTWRNQESIYMPNPKRARVDYHSVSSLIAQPQAEEPKSKKIPHKKSVQEPPKLSPLYSVSIMPGNGLKLRFTCRSKETTVSHPDTKKVSNRCKRQ